LNVAYLVLKVVTCVLYVARIIWTGNDSTDTR
jgi:hypothetical protein